MSLNVLGISASPRKDGNSDLLLKKALDAAASAGANTQYISLMDKKISPCTECGYCYGTGRCNIDDDYQQILKKLLNADRLIFSTPVFFMNVPAQLKLLIDRCQCLWAAKYVLKKPLIEAGRDRRVLLIAVGATKGQKMFDSIQLTMKYFLDALDAHLVAYLSVNNVSDAAAILNHPHAMKEAHRLGISLVTDIGQPLAQPERVVLT